MKTCVKVFLITILAIAVLSVGIAINEEYNPMPRKDGQKLMEWYCVEHNLDSDNYKLIKTWYGWDFTKAV